MSFRACWLSVLWGQMYVIGCLKRVNMVQGQQDDPLKAKIFALGKWYSSRGLALVANCELSILGFKDKAHQCHKASQLCIHHRHQSGMYHTANEPCLCPGRDMTHAQSLSSINTMLKSMKDSHVALQPRKDPLILG